MDHRVVQVDDHVQITRNVVKYMEWINVISGALSANGRRHARVLAISGRDARTHMRGQGKQNERRVVLLIHLFTQHKIKYDKTFAVSENCSAINS